MNKVQPSTYQQYLQALRSRSLPEAFSEMFALLTARLQLASVTQHGKWIRAWGRVVVSNPGEIAIGDQARLKGTITPIELVTGPKGRIEIGSCAFINYGVSISAMLYISIGSDCSIGPYCNIIDNAFHRLEPERRNELPDSQPVVIEENVWLGSRVIVLPGVKIGKDSVIGAGSVVTKDIPARSVAAGVPAKVLRAL